MVWYVPPLSPVVDSVTASGLDGEDHKVLLTTLSTMRIPLEYLAGLFTAGDTRPVEKSLRRLAAMRSYMRDINLGNEPNEEIAQSVGMTGKEIEAMYRLLAIAKYDDRYVIPTSSPESPRGITSLDPFGDVDPTNPVKLLDDLGMGAPEACSTGCGSGDSQASKISLVSWSNGERPAGMFPDRGAQ